MKFDKKNGQYILKDVRVNKVIDRVTAETGYTIEDTTDGTIIEGGLNLDAVIDPHYGSKASEYVYKGVIVLNGKDIYSVGYNKMVGNIFVEGI